MRAPVIIVQPFNDDGTAEKITAEAKAQGIEVFSPKYVPWLGIAEDVPTDRPVIAFCGINYAKALARTQAFPGTWLDFKALRCSTYLPQLQQFSIHRRFGFYPFRVLENSRFMLQALFADHQGNLFIRPDENDKSFTGAVVNLHADHDPQSNVESWWQFIGSVGYQLEPNTMVLVSTPRRSIDAEWRFVIADNKVLTCSQYQKYGKHHEEQGCSNKEAVDMASEIAQCAWEPAPIYLVDIASTPDGVAMLELACVNTAGLYACNYKLVLDRCIEQAVKEYEEQNE